MSRKPASLVCMRKRKYWDFDEFMDDMKQFDQRAYLCKVCQCWHLSAHGSERQFLENMIWRSLRSAATGRS